MAGSTVVCPRSCGNKRLRPCAHHGPADTGRRRRCDRVAEAPGSPVPNVAGAHEISSASRPMARGPIRRSGSRRRQWACRSGRHDHRLRDGAARGRRFLSFSCSTIAKSRLRHSATAWHILIPSLRDVAERAENIFGDWAGIAYRQANAQEKLAAGTIAAEDLHGEPPLSLLVPLATSYFSSNS